MTRFKNCSFARDFGIAATFCCWARKCWCAIKERGEYLCWSLSLSLSLSPCLSSSLPGDHKDLRRSPRVRCYSRVSLRVSSLLREGRRGRGREGNPSETKHMAAALCGQLRKYWTSSQYNNPPLVKIPRYHCEIAACSRLTRVITPGPFWWYIETDPWNVVFNLTHSKIHRFQPFFVAFSSIIETCDHLPLGTLTFCSRSRIAWLVHFFSTKNLYVVASNL